MADKTFSPDIYNLTILDMKNVFKQQKICINIKKSNASAHSYIVCGLIFFIILIFLSKNEDSLVFSKTLMGKGNKKFSA